MCFLSKFIPAFSMLKETANYVISTFFMILVLLMIQNRFSVYLSGPLYTIIQVIAGVATYFGTCLLIGDSFLREKINNAVNKLKRGRK